MKTYLWKEIDGYKVVIGFDKPLINSVTTRKKVHEMIKDWPETANVTKAKKTHYENLKAINIIKKEIPKNAKELSAHRKKLDDAVVIKDASAISLRNAHGLLQKRTKESMDQIVQYFDLKKGEEMISVEQFEQLKIKHDDAVKNGQVLIVEDGVYAVRTNKKGKKYHLLIDGNLIENKVQKIGDDLPEGAILELNGAQREKINEQKSIKANVEDGGETKKLVLEKVLREAAIKKTEKEIKGKTSAVALAESKQWYQDEVDIIEALYII